MDRFNRWQNISPALLRTLEDLRAEFQQALGPTAIPAGNWSPAVDVFETETEWVFLVELAGLKQEDIRIHLDGDELTLAGDRPYMEPEGAKAHRIERTYGSFQRTFRLPPNTNHERIKANLKEGILSLRLPKVEAARSRAIQISQEE
ncbi:Hsp20/alpha crystallin family protein [bacterium]|nr:Hsp20/alpha crystallin family protein [bacterium]